MVLWFWMLLVAIGAIGFTIIVLRSFAEPYPKSREQERKDRAEARRRDDDSDLSNVA